VHFIYIEVLQIYCLDNVIIIKVIKMLNIYVANTYHYIVKKLYLRKEILLKEKKKFKLVRRSLFKAPV
jgi:hypothetical protein